MKRSMICAVFPVVISVTAANAGTAKLDEIGKVLDALRAAGCSSLTELHAKSDGYKVDGVACSDGQVYNMKLSKTFEIVKKRKD